MHRERTKRNYNTNSVNSYVRIMGMMGDYPLPVFPLMEMFWNVLMLIL